MEQSEHKYQRLDLRPHHQCGRKRSAFGDNQRAHRLLEGKGIIATDCTDLTDERSVKSVASVAMILLFFLSSCQPHSKPNPTFSEDIASIVFKNCAPCHRPGEVGPFPLLNYQDVVKKAKTI